MFTWYRIIDLTTGRTVAGVYAKSAKSAKAYYTRKMGYLTFMGASPVGN